MLIEPTISPRAQSCSTVPSKLRLLRAQGDGWVTDQSAFDKQSACSALLYCTGSMLLHPRYHCRPTVNASKSAFSGSAETGTSLTTTATTATEESPEAIVSGLSPVFTGGGGGGNGDLQPNASIPLSPHPIQPHHRLNPQYQSTG